MSMMMSPGRGSRPAGILRFATPGFFLCGALAAIALWLVIPAPSVDVRVAWTDGLTEAARTELERRFSLEGGAPTEGTTWSYSLTDYSTANIRALVEHRDVRDTQAIDRTLFRPAVIPKSRVAPIVLGAIVAGACAVLLLGLWTLIPAAAAWPWRTITPLLVIVAVVTVTYLPVLRSGDKVLLNNDFFLFVSRQEAVAQSVRMYQTLPLRSHWLGGGFPTIADPEDPALNPLVLFSVLLGGVKGVKAIGYLSMLIGGLATYALARQVLGYTRWGALFSALVFGTCLFVPGRIAGGNTNEVYGAWLPLGLLLIGLALQGRQWALIVLPLVFYTMVSDGKLTALMSMFYIGTLCLLSVVPSLRVLSPAGGEARRLDHRPLTFFLVAVGLTLLIGLPRLLPAFEMISERGSLAGMIEAHPQAYSAARVSGYSFDELWKGALGWGRGAGPETLNRDLLTVGVIPVVLSGIAFLVFWRRMLGWGVVLAFFVWLVLAHHAPVDLLAVLWNLPVFEAIHRPNKYFSFQIAFTLAIVAGQSFHLLRQLESRRVEALIATILIAFSVGFLSPRASSMLANTFTADEPDIERPREGFFNVGGQGIAGLRPSRDVPLFNLHRDIGTLDGFSAVPLPTQVAPAYFVGADDEYIPNPAYRGEAYFLDSAAVSKVADITFRPNTITVSVDVKAPGTLVINQNYHRDWYTDRGAVSDHDGLLALRLAEPGRYSVHLDYRPRSFYAGVAGTLLGLVAIAAVWWRGTRLRSGLWFFGRAKASAAERA